MYILKNKSKVFNVFKNFLPIAEKQSGHKLKILRLDNGGEYKSGEFSNFYKSHGIRRQFSVPYTPPQYGVAERKN